MSFRREKSHLTIVRLKDGASELLFFNVVRKTSVTRILGGEKHIKCPVGPLYYWFQSGINSRLLKYKSWLIDLGRNEAEWLNIDASK